MNLRQGIISAGRWSAASALARTCLQIVQTAVLARMLAPADFGLMAVTTSMFAVIALFADLGLSRAIIHFKSIPNHVLASLYWLNMLVSLALSFLLAALAPLLGDIFKLNGLSTVLAASSPIFILTAAGQQFRTLAEKELRFSTLALIEIASSVCGFIFALFVALKGAGVYSLVVSLLVTAAVSSALSWWHLAGRRTPLLRFRTKEAKPFLRFGSYLIGEGLINALFRQADVLIAAPMASPAALGLFSVPRDLSMRIGMAVNPIITRIGFPVMSRLKNDQSSLNSTYLQTLRMTASVNFPAYVALALFADEVVAWLYGPHWKGAVVYLRILAAWGLLRSTGNPVGSLLYAVGAVRRAFFWNVALLLIVPLLYWVGMKGWGLIGLSFVLLGVHLALVVPSWYFLVRPCCGATSGDYLEQLTTPLLIALFAGLAAWLATRNVLHGTLRISIGGVVGGLTYLGLSNLFNRVWFDSMWILLHLPVRANNSSRFWRR